jgi:hypothetical protein
VYGCLMLMCRLYGCAVSVLVVGCSVLWHEPDQAPAALQRTRGTCVCESCANICMYVYVDVCMYMDTYYIYNITI